MKEILQQYGNAILEAVTLALLLSIITSVAIFGTGGLLGKIGSKSAEITQTDGYTISGSNYKDTEYAVSTSGRAPFIVLNSAPKKNVETSVSALFSASQEGSEVPVKLAYVTEFATGENAIKAGSVSYDSQTKKITFLKGGTYCIRIRAFGSVVTKKTFVVSVQ